MTLNTQPSTPSFVYWPRRLRRWLWFVTGADLQVLSNINCPESERTKFDSIGAAMCLTTGLAFLAGWVAFYQIFFPGLHEYELIGTPWRAVISLLFALIWTLVIFNMQRFIMLSSQRVSNYGVLRLVDWLHTVPGALLSFSVALTVATPLQVILLEPEIDVELIRERQLEKGRVHESIERRFESERLAIAEDAIQSRERSGGDISTIQAFPICLKGVTGNTSDTVEAEQSRCLRDVEVWHAKVAKRMEVWKQRHPQQGSMLAPHDEADWLALRNEWLQARIARERLLSDITLDQGAGLIKRAGIAYSVNPLSSWGLLLVVCFIQGIPVIIRTVSPKGPYDDLLDMVSREHLAAAGIEPVAVSLFGRHGKSYPIDLYRIAKDKEQQMLISLQALRAELRASRLAEYENRYAHIHKTRTPGGNDATNPGHRG